MHRDSKASRLPTYEIVLQGRLNKDWSEWLDGLEISHEGDETVLRGNVRDQAALRGILAKMWDLNRTLISVTQIEDLQQHRSERPVEEKVKKPRNKPAPLPPDAVVMDPNEKFPARKVPGSCAS